MSDMTVDAAKVVAKLQARLTDAVTQATITEVALDDALERELALQAELAKLKDSSKKSLATSVTARPPG